MAVDPRKFLLNTDYEMDKIILVKTGDFTDKKYISHSLGFTPLAFGVWSLDENFTSCNVLGPFSSGDEVGYTPPLGVECVAKDNQIMLDAVGDGAQSTKIYYRIYCLAPTDTNAGADATSDLANKFILNTDYNYRKLKATGEFTQSGQSYNHNLGYIPQVMAWVKYKELPYQPDYSHAIAPLNDMSFATNYYIAVTENKIECSLPSLNLADKIIWRIYYDEA